LTGRSRGHVGEYSPAEALQTARRLISPKGVERGWFDIDPRVYYRLDELGIAPDELTSALLKIVHEISPGDYSPPAQPNREPGIPFIFHSPSLRRDVYFKFKLIGPRPRLRLYSLHRPDYPKRRKGEQDALL
jgi:hypothetical protein